MDKFFEIEVKVTPPYPRDDIIRMAREAGWVVYEDMPYMDVQALQDALIERLERFAALVAAAEREACAKLADKYMERWTADAIRARGET